MLMKKSLNSLIKVKDELHKNVKSKELGSLRKILKIKLKIRVEREEETVTIKCLKKIYNTHY